MSRGILSMQPEAIGTTVLGAPIEVYAPETGVSSVLVMAGQHGEESETVILLSRVLRSLERPLATHVILCANPDGTQRGTRGNARGVELNRNFATSNWRDEAVHHRWSLNGEQDTPLSPGEYAGSEPETRALIDFIHQRNIQTIVSLHAPLACIDDPNETPLARTLANRSGLPLVTSVGYPTPGSLGTWGTENGLDIITYELPPKSVWSLMETHAGVLSDLLAGTL